MPRVRSIKTKRIFPLRIQNFIRRYIFADILARIKLPDYKLFIRYIRQIHLTRNYYIESKLLHDKIFIHCIAQIIHVPCSRFSHTNSFATAVLHHFITYPSHLCREQIKIKNLRKTKALSFFNSPVYRL